MKIGLIGLPQSGKTTLFQILTQTDAPVTGKIEDRMGVVRIPDDRLDRLHDLYDPKKTTPASFEVVDPAFGFPPVGGRPKSGDKDPYAAIRNADALLAVVRAFANDAVPHSDGSVDAGRDAQAIEEELVLTDLVHLDARLEKIAKQEKVGKKELAAEKPLLEKLHEHLQEGTPLREVELSLDDEKKVRGYSFLSRKPLVVVYNTGEEGEAPEDAPKVNREVAALPAKAELEVMRLPEEERGPFRELFSISESGLDTLLGAAGRALHLIVFFTAGPPEVRAWHLQTGGNAVDAAGKIHTDIAKGFIRAEVVRWDQLLEAQTLGATRDKGWLRTEGRDYVVQDGDVLHILHNS